MEAIHWLWLGYLLLVNSLTYYMMYRDKQLARTHRWRIPERRLLMLGFIGGGLGGLLAQKKFRHKTKKRYFHLVFFIGCVVMIGGTIVIFN